MADPVKDQIAQEKYGKSFEELDGEWSNGADNWPCTCTSYVFRTVVVLHPPCAFEPDKLHCG